MVMKQPARRFGPVQKKRNKAGRPRTYPWDKWFATDTSVHPIVLTRRVHFFCQTHGMVQQFRQRALDRGVCVSIRIENDDTLIVKISR